MGGHRLHTPNRIEKKVARKRIITLLGRRGHVVAQGLDAAGIVYRFDKKLKGPRRIIGVGSDLFRQLNRAGQPPAAVLTDSFEYVPLGLLVSKWLKLPHIVRVRGDPWAELAQPEIRRSMAYWPARLLMTRYETGLAQAAAIVPVCDYLGHRILERLPVKEQCIYSIPISVDDSTLAHMDRVEAKRYLQLTGDPILLTVTNFRFPSKARGITTYLPGVLEILDRYPRAVYVIAGGGPYLTQFENEIAERAGILRDRVRFVGHISDLGPLYSASSIVLHLTELDAYPRAILEAQILRRVVVANRFAGIPEMIDNQRTGVLIEQPEELTAQCAMLLEYPDRMNCIADRAHVRVQKLNSPASIGQRWGALIESVADYPARNL